MADLKTTTKISENTQEVVFAFNTSMLMGAMKVLSARLMFLL